MKKLIAILSVLILALSLCACGGDKPSEPSVTFPQAPEQPTNTDGPTEAPSAMTEEEELQILGRYGTLAFMLENDHLVNHYPLNQDGNTFKDIYLELQSMDQAVIHKYAGSELLNYDDLKPYGLQYRGEINWNYDDVMSSFRETDTVLLGVTCETADAVGNVAKIPVLQYAYDGEGNRIGTATVHHEDPSVHLQDDIITGVYTDLFDLTDAYAAVYEDGNVRYLDSTVGRQDWRDARILIQVIHTVDENGRRVHTGITTDKAGQAEILYTYEGDLLVKAELHDISAKRNWDAEVSYTYENGKVVRSLYTEFNSNGQRTWEVETVFTYDAQGHLESAVRHNYECWYDTRYYDTEITYTFTCDEEGRILSETMVYGDTYDVHVGPSKHFATAVVRGCTATFTWDTVVAYQPANG